MAENLNVGVMVVGEGGADGQSDDTKIEKFCHGDVESACDNGYGGLYQWAEMLGLPYRCNTEDCTDEIGYGTVRQGICPYGWRIPVADDWNALHLALADEKFKGVSKMKLATTPFDEWNSSENDGNSSYFSAVPAGMRVVNGGFLDWGESAYFWYLSSGFSWSSADYTSFQKFDAATRYSMSTRSGLSVRCVKN